MARGRAAGEARRRQVEAAPEEMDRAGLADEAGLEALQRGVHLEQRPPEQVGVPRVVRNMLLVLFERDGVGELHRMGPEGDIEWQFRRREECGRGASIRPPGSPDDC